MDKYKVLKQYFGYDSFRPGQEKIIDAILSGRDAFGIMPTGGGKSLCYQIPALMSGGVTLVVSPLISLMKDQVMQLRASGIPAAFINSTLTPSQQNLAYDRMRSGEYKIVYVAPERLETEEFAYVAKGLNISLFAIDEAHCISQWGHDFRKSYLRIADFIATLPKRPVVAAFTATATERVRLDIEELLRLKNPEKVITSFDRPNLSYTVLKPKNKTKSLISLVSERARQSGIIYCSTRSGVERICERLCDEGISATRYHAGLADSEKSENQENFQYDRKSVMVATNAFGMGINKSNVNYVIHYNMPKSLEEYYQEAGRAGRDGENAECILLYSSGDSFTAKALIAGEGVMPPSDDVLWEQFPKEMEKLSAMTDYCETMDCYRGKILDYFGEAHPEFCGNCGNCKDEFEVLDITVEAQMILSCISRIKAKLGFCVGKTTVKEVLIGKNSVRVERYGLSDIKTFGVMKEKTRDEAEYLIDIMISEGLVSMSTEFKTLDLTEKSRSVLFDGEAVFGKFRKKSAEELSEDKRGRKKKKAEKTSGKADTEFTSESAELYEKLRSLRYEIAAREKIPAYAVFSNAALSDMVKRMPTTMDEFLEVFGVGEAKARKYGKAFLDVIAEYCKENKGDAVITAEKPTSETVPQKEEKTETPQVKAYDFASLLKFASGILADLPHTNGTGVPARVTVLVTANGSVYSAVNTEGINKLGIGENKMLSTMIREYDTRVARILTMWYGGNVVGTDATLLSRFVELERKNRDTEVLVAKSVSITFSGEYIPENYTVKKISDFM
ncbi:MAG: DNA helicase RecQ [Clostridia bacterium]|nr:DNA helicase RecQ [Clostridia bacterium]